MRNARYSDYERRPEDRYPDADGRGYDDRPYYRERYRDDRGFFDRAADEVRSWVGDDEAERRRRLDEAGYWRSRSRFGNVRAQDLMTRDVATVSPYDSIEQAARLMRKCECGSLPVTDDLGRVVGMITDRDIVVRLVARGADSRYAVVHDYMTDDVIACHADDPVEGCMRQMSRDRVRRLPIVDDRDRLIGILTQADMARLAGTQPVGRGERRAVSDTLSAISQPPGDTRQ